MTRSRTFRTFTGLVLLFVALGQYALASRDALDESQRGLFTLRLGECFDAPEGTDIIGGVVAKSCTEVHQFEVFGFGELSERDEFQAEEIAAEADAICVPEFERYVGIPATESKLSLMHLSPTLASWESDDRSVTCLLLNPEGALRNSMIRSKV